MPPGRAPLPVPTLITLGQTDLRGESGQDRSRIGTVSLGGFESATGVACGRVHGEMPHR